MNASTQNLTWLPEIAAELDTLTVKHTAYCDVWLYGDRGDGGFPSIVELPVWETKPEGEFSHLEFVPIYSVDSMKHVGYIENGSFGTDIEFQLHLAEGGRMQNSDIYDREFKIYKDALTRNESDDIKYIEAVWPRLSSLKGFGYIMETTSECRDGEIEGPASIAAWEWLADFASPQNEPVEFNNRATGAVGIPWVDFAVTPPEEMTDNEEIREYLDVDASSRARRLEVEYYGQLG